MTLDVQAIRARFPALQRQHEGRPVIHLDGPAGSQVPETVIAAVADYLAHHNANTKGVFSTARETEAILEEAHRACADFLGAEDPDEVAFGPNMTTLTFALSHALEPSFARGQRILVTRLDHDANITPWTRMAHRAGLEVDWVDIDPDRCTLDLEDLRRKLSAGSVGLLAVTAASNAVGTLTPIREITQLAHDAGALVFVDAVHYAAHAAVDVRDWDCDFLACSPYKFFGPHMGLLWGRRALMESLDVDRVRPAPQTIPGRWMTGTQSHEGIAGVAAAIAYIASLGEGASRRAKLLDAYRRIGVYEQSLSRRLIEGLGEITSLRVLGLADRDALGQRVPTVSVVHRALTPSELAEHLAAAGIFAWPGHHYAIALSERLGLEPHGMLRLGALHYNTLGEVERLLAILQEA